MKILIQDTFVDLECPIYMSERQKNKFIDGMKPIFKDSIVVENIIEKKKAQIEFGIRFEQIKSKNAEEYLTTKKEELRSKIKKLKEETEKMGGL